MPLPLLNYFAFSVIFILLSWAIYLPYRCGQLYLAPVYCMATGAYFAAYSLIHWHWPISLSILGGVFTGAIFAFLPALGLRRAPGFATAIASLGLVFIIQTVIMNLPFVGGKIGLFGIPPAEYPLTTVLIVLVVAGIIVYRIDHSRLGRAAELLYYGSGEAACFGVNMALIGMLLQVLSGALSGAAGVLYAFTVGSVFPGALSFSVLLVAFSAVFIGGNFTMWGPLVLAPILWGIPLILPEAVADWQDVIYGGLLIGALILRPEGVISKQTAREVGTMIERLTRRKGLPSD
jgi:branched-chain amino acid transport system permease protein